MATAISNKKDNGSKSQGHNPGEDIETKRFQHVNPISIRMGRLRPQNKVSK